MGSSDNTTCSSCYHEADSVTCLCCEPCALRLRPKKGWFTRFQFLRRWSALRTWLTGCWLLGPRVTGANWTGASLCGLPTTLEQRIDQQNQLELTTRVCTKTTSQRCSRNKQIKSLGHIDMSAPPNSFKRSRPAIDPREAENRTPRIAVYSR